ncbi:unnamed protein product [Schistosoma curassoni]|uniref:Transposase n=1 Tax=Schistosoma curassoni TaxID=6186 RepID=A0A183JQK1_9TREM|nr:unnamed protein product [Schistosoma curassoni]
MFCDIADFSNPKLELFCRQRQTIKVYREGEIQVV